MMKKTTRRVSSRDDFLALDVILSPLMALIAPFFAWIFEFLLPYPAIIEELLKAFLVYNVIHISKKSTKLKLAIVMGVLFAVSETVLYLVNYLSLGSFSPLLLRLILTGTLHSLTMVIMTCSTFINTKLLIPALGLAILIHYLYNGIFLPTF